jgi:hypothetical protein
MLPFFAASCDHIRRLRPLGHVLSAPLRGVVKRLSVKAAKGFGPNLDHDFLLVSRTPWLAKRGLQDHQNPHDRSNAAALIQPRFWPC